MQLQYFQSVLLYFTAATFPTRAGFPLKTINSKKLRRRRSIRRLLSRIGGSVRDPDLAHFANVSAFSSVQNGSGEPPDRAEMCSCDVEARLKLFFSEPVSGPPKVNIKR